MIDPVNLVLGPPLVECLVERLRRLEVPPEWFLDHQSRIALPFSQAHGGKALRGRPEYRRRERQIEHAVAGKVVLLLDRLDRCLQRFVVRSLAVADWMVGEKLPGPRFRRGGLHSGLHQRLNSHRAEAVVVLVGACHANHVHPGRGVGGVEVLQRRQDHALGEVSGASEKHEDRGMLHFSPPSSLHARQTDFASRPAAGRQMPSRSGT